MQETSFFENRFFQSVSYSANDGGRQRGTICGIETHCTRARSRWTELHSLCRRFGGKGCPAAREPGGVPPRGGAEKRCRGFAARQSRRPSDNKRAKSKAHKAPYSFERRGCRPVLRSFARVLLPFGAAGAGFVPRFRRLLQKAGETVMCRNADKTAPLTSRSFAA